MAGPIAVLGQFVGAPEPALRLLLSILVGYPLAAIYRHFIFNKQPPTISHIFFSVTGLLLCIFNYGYDSYHSAISILFTYLLIRFMYKSKYFVIINFIFHMIYLLTGYYFTESDDYDIKWTMPHCVLVLRLIGFAYDISDGLKSPESLSGEQKETAITRIPSLLEMMAFSYFPASCLVGPQFPFRRYERFTNADYKEYTGNVSAGLTRGGLGFLYLSIRQIGAIWLPDSYFFTSEFANTSYFIKLCLLGIWGKIALYKYISCWLFAEGAATCFGLTFVKIDQNGVEDWSGCSNVKLEIFETASKLGHYVLSFNVNTNHWVAQYVYKRLKFLGNRTISYASALVFLAIWHGFHTGYYMSFLLEYLVITFEKQFKSVFDALKPNYGYILDSTGGKAVIFILCKFYTLVGMGWCLVPFIFLSFDKWIRVYSFYNYFGYIFLGTWFLGQFIYSKFLRKKKTHTPNKNPNENNQIDEGKLHKN